ncbi:unnamed protein product [Effrenium voratum]|nr:unnamed protein product [Effrenium voratum]
MSKTPSPLETSSPLEDAVEKERSTSSSFYSPTSSRRVQVPVHANFIRAYTLKKTNTSLRSRVGKVLDSYFVTNLMAVAVLADSFCTCASVDARAAGAELAYGYSVIAQVCLCLYTTELLCNAYVRGSKMCRDWIGALDVVIVIFGWAENIVSAAIASDIGLPLGVLRVFRLVRIARTIRLLKRLRMLRELYKLIVMMASVFRTLMWSFLLCFLVMTGFAMLIVEFVNPIMQDLNEQFGTFEDCPFCLQSTSTVMEANLLLFQTVVAGDSWGRVAVPVIHASPATALIFIGSLLTLVFGVLNLIVAVVVDTFAEARLHDVEALAEELEIDLQADREQLNELFQRIDKQGTGELTLDELIDGARNDATFQSRLKVMDIDESDLQQLFHMIDVDQSGTLQVSEFVGPLSRWAHDSKTAPRFIKYNLMQSMQMQEDLIDVTERRFEMLSQQIDLLAGGRAMLSHDEASELSQPMASPEAPDQSLPASCRPQLIVPFRKPRDSVRRDSATSGQMDKQMDKALAQIDAKLEALLQRAVEDGSSGPVQRLASGGKNNRSGVARRPSFDAFRAMYMEASGPKRKSGRKPTADKPTADKLTADKSGSPDVKLHLDPGSA